MTIAKERDVRVSMRSANRRAGEAVAGRGDTAVARVRPSLRRAGRGIHTAHAHM